MKIIDLNGEKINACFVFNVGNCEISVSTIFKSTEIAIFRPNGGDMLKDKIGSISQAIEWVNNYGPRD